MAWRKLRMIAHQEQYLTSRGPMKVWFDRARELERHPRVLSISTFPMQPWLDAEEGGWATVAVTDGDTAFADRLVDELADLAWSMRADFQVTESLSPDDAVRAADSEAEGIVVLSDTGDLVFAGGAGDSTTLIESMQRVGDQGPSTGAPRGLGRRVGVDGRGRRSHGDARPRRRHHAAFSARARYRRRRSGRVRAMCSSMSCRAANSTWGKPRCSRSDRHDPDQRAGGDRRHHPTSSGRFGIEPPTTRWRS